MCATILVTGGLGYIGSHTTVELIQAGFTVIIADDLSNSEEFIQMRIEEITGVRPLLYQVDLCDMAAAEKVFNENSIDVVIHFAACKSVNESVRAPLKYFQNNLLSLMNVLQSMQEHKVENIIFSSSATVYGAADKLPVTEASPFQKPLSAYASTKQMAEDILEKVCAAGNIKNISLRYFNPVGAHATALIGELPRGIPNNLFPYVTQTGIGKLKKLTVFGVDYDTPDGSCIRDYIHVVDLAKAHVQACKRLRKKESNTFFEVFNIGTGRGTSVLEIIKTFEETTGVKLYYSIGPRRNGDAAAVYACTSRANTILGWKAELDLNEMITSAWNWELQLNKK